MVILNGRSIQHSIEKSPISPSLNTRVYAVGDGDDGGEGGVVLALLGNWHWRTTVWLCCKGTVGQKAGEVARRQFQLFKDAHVWSRIGTCLYVCSTLGTV